MHIASRIFKNVFSQPNVLKQNAKNVPTDNFETKRHK